MKSSLLKITQHGLNSEGLKFSAPQIEELRIHQSAIRETFLAWTRVDKNYTDGKIFSGYATCLRQKRGLEESKAVAKSLLNKGIDTMLVLGIGGSSLGGKCIYEALKLSKDLRRLIFLENIDPLVLDDTLESLDFKKTAFAVITKSGSTIETLAQFAQILSIAQKDIGAKWKDHIVAITDPQKGDLRKWATKEQITTLEVPPEIGGRFSVFTPVGMLPLAFAGVDVDALTEGAADFFAGKVVALEEIETLCLRLMDLLEQGADTHVIMPYATALKPLGDWCVQLIGESLGKLRAPQKRVGITPLAALGATDQHSLLQLLMEGPPKFVTHFVEVEKWPAKAAKYKFLDLPAEFTALKFAYGKPLFEILNHELNSTATAMERSGRAYFKITLSEIEEANLGALLAFYMDSVSYLGAALRIDPYNQPGVELGKVILKDLLSS